VTVDGTEETPKSEARGYRIEGRVQGVGFRWWTRQMATQLGLRGTVRNCSDGSVELRVAGAMAELEELESRLGQGPPPARVDAVERVAEAPCIEGTGFEIVR